MALRLESPHVRSGHLLRRYTWAADPAFVTPHTSIKARIDRAKAYGLIGDLKKASRGHVAGSKASGKMEDFRRICPIEARHLLDSTREGLGAVAGSRRSGVR